MRKGTFKKANVTVSIAVNKNVLSVSAPPFFLSVLKYSFKKEAKKQGMENYKEEMDVLTSEPNLLIVRFNDTPATEEGEQSIFKLLRVSLLKGGFYELN